MILIADIDRETCTTVGAVAETLGFSTTVARTGAGALAIAGESMPGLVLLAVDLPDPCAYEVLRQLRERLGDGLPIACLSAVDEQPRDEIAALLLGADDYLLKPLRADRLAVRMRRLLRGSHQPQLESALGSLTNREREVLTLLAAGLRSAEIAASLCITKKTAATHIERILVKLRVHSQSQAVALALRNGMD